jgi:hypothetical protein
VLQNEYAKEIAPSFGAKGMTWMRAEVENWNPILYSSSAIKSLMGSRRGLM